MNEITIRPATEGDVDSMIAFGTAIAELDASGETHFIEREEFLE